MLALLAACGVGVLLSVLAGLKWEPLEGGGRRLSALAVWAFACLVALVLFEGVEILLAGLLLAACGMWFVLGSVGHWFDGLRGWWTAESDVRAVRSYDRAEQAEAMGDWAEAGRLYLEYAQADPEDYVPRVRLAEVWVKLDRIEEAVREIRRVLPRIEDEERRAVHAARACELLERSLARPVESRELLQEILLGISNPDVRSWLGRRMSPGA